MSDLHSAETSRLAPGTRLNGIFEIEQRIASGGMGEIYRGHAIETGDPVAIKVMRTDLADNTMALALFRKEASALHHIHHEAIVRYYIFSNDPGIGRHYLAMEFVDGQPLSELLQRGPLDFAAVRLLQERLAAGLNAVHQHGIVHRDLSPDNVLIPGGNLARAKIIDFGISRSTRVGDGTIIGSGFAGKYNYVSPEQLGLFGGDVTAKSDIYSLGLVLAQCLTGQPIDMGGTQFEILEKRRVVPDLQAIDRRLRPLLEKMLQPNPADRPESMAAVAAWRPEQETVVSPRAAAIPAAGQTAKPAAARPAVARPVVARPVAARPAAVDRPKPTSGRRFAKVALGLVLLLGVGSGGLYFAQDLIWPQDKEQPKPPDLTPPNPNPREDQGPAVPGPGPLPLRQRIIDFVNAYDGGDCFFILPETIEDGKAAPEGLGSSVAPFEVFNYEFIRQLGIEPLVGVHKVTQEQCPAVSFLSRTRNQPGTRPRLDINTAGLRSGAPLTGSVAGFGDRHLELLLVTDDGYVFNVTARLKAGGDIKTFSLPLRKNNPGPPQPQLLIAVVSSRPLDALKLPQDGTLAEQVFPQALTEALQSGQPLNVSVKNFVLEK